MEMRVRKLFLGTMLLILAVLVIPRWGFALDPPGRANPVEVSRVYIPGKAYPGIFGAEQLYYRYPKTFWKGTSHPALLKEVICYPARLSLERYGHWTGALKRDGSCGVGDPAIWATGNYVNYTMSAPSN